MNIAHTWYPEYQTHRQKNFKKAKVNKELNHIILYFISKIVLIGTKADLKTDSNALTTLR